MPFLLSLSKKLHFWVGFSAIVLHHNLFFFLLFLSHFLSSSSTPKKSHFLRWIFVISLKPVTQCNPFFKCIFHGLVIGISLFYLREMMPFREICHHLYVLSLYSDEAMSSGVWQAFTCSFLIRSSLAIIFIFLIFFYFYILGSFFFFVICCLFSWVGF